ASSGDALFANLEYTAIHPVWEQANQALDKLVTVNEAGAYAATARSVSTVESAVLWITGMSAAAISVAILIALLLSRQITRPLRML
ncbi:hypothetical protein MXD63_45340, partial [Frankia sp. Cpl3]|nr:hypothetical protein [Frankia sp. Cpl3]